ncbi:hypothetical protein TIFTF001_021395 [Ficus carica]|uniref:Uncharacterized protein n=1 Tax=Ficus carica TaxID=3494 RepID=A0AA88ASI0_FICCA|nr:hypothetical protein TIFTF001_021395 [Ficus carica]
MKEEIASTLVLGRQSSEDEGEDNGHLGAGTTIVRKGKGAWAQRRQSLKQDVIA